MQPVTFAVSVAEDPGQNDDGPEIETPTAGGTETVDSDRAVSMLGAETNNPKANVALANR